MATSNGRILLRIESRLHQRLLARAKENQQSLNDLCLERLAVPSLLEGAEREALRSVVSRAEELLNQDLLGVVFYGSRARGEGRTDSDWDVLVVTSNQITLSRQIYRNWDKHFAQLSSPEIEVHFVHLPPKTTVASGFWGEVALDGFVLFDRDFVVSKHLARVRREIAHGEILRKTVHGQSYWVHREAT